MYKVVTSIVRCGLGMQPGAMHNAAIQKTTFLELCVYNKQNVNGTESSSWCSGSGHGFTTRLLLYLLFISLMFSIQFLLLELILDLIRDRAELGLIVQ